MIISNPTYSWPIPPPKARKLDPCEEERIHGFWGWLLPFRAQYAGIQRTEILPRQADLVARIRTAFAKVGVGADATLYLSGAAEDCYLPEAYQAHLRAHEERRDWQRIPAEVLFCLHDCFPYLQAEGVRFLLPAYMVADLEYPAAHWSRDFGLDHALFSSRAGESLALLNEAQRACVTDYVNEKRLEEAPDWDSAPFYDWRNLLPWEEEERQTSSPDQAPYLYAEDQLLRYCEKHGIPL